MTKARSITFASLVWATPIFWSLSTSVVAARPAQAAPQLLKSKTTAANVSNRPLVFDVTARITLTGPNKTPGQVLKAQVALNGPKARVQTLVAGNPVVVLYSPPYIYRLLPKAKSGVRWKVDANNKSVLNSFDPQQLLRDPTQIRATLLRNGAKRTSVAPLNGVPTEVYELKGADSRFQALKVWIRRADSLPLRLEANGQGVKIAATWSSYSQPKSLPAVLFTPPSKYNIRELRTAPPMAGL